MLKKIIQLKIKAVNRLLERRNVSIIGHLYRNIRSSLSINFSSYSNKVTNIGDKALENRQL